MADNKAVNCWMITGSVDEYVVTLRAENAALREACEAALPQLEYMRRRGLIPPEFRSHADNVIKQIRAALEVK